MIFAYLIKNRFIKNIRFYIKIECKRTKCNSLHKKSYKIPIKIKTALIFYKTLKNYSSRRVNSSPNLSSKSFTKSEHLIPNASDNFHNVINWQLLLPRSNLLNVPLFNSYSFANLFIVELFLADLNSLKISPKTIRSYPG